MSETVVLCPFIKVIIVMCLKWRKVERKPVHNQTLSTFLSGLQLNTGCEGEKAFSSFNSPPALMCVMSCLVRLFAN